MARTKQTSNLTPPVEMKEKKGFMSLRNNVFATKVELGKKVTLLEYMIVDVIIEKTIGWNQEEAKITVQELVDRTEQRKDYIYIALSKLEAMGVIKRRKVKHDLFMSLDENYFGELLTKRQQNLQQLRRNRIKTVVDNSKNKTENQSSLDCNPVQTRLESSLTKTVIQSKKSTNNLESLGNLVSKDILKDNIKNSLKDSESGVGESYAPSWETKEKAKPSEELKKQYAYLFKR